MSPDSLPEGLSLYPQTKTFFKEATRQILIGDLVSSSRFFSQWITLVIFNASTHEAELTDLVDEVYLEFDQPEGESEGVFLNEERCAYLTALIAAFINGNYNNAIQYFYSLAFPQEEAGSLQMKAMTHLAFLYTFCTQIGFFSEENQNAALSQVPVLYQQASSSDPEAKARYARLNAADVLDEERNQLLRDAAEQNETLAMVSLAGLQEVKPDDAMALLQRAAELGDSVAMGKLGDLHRGGDIAKALDWYDHAIVSGAENVYQEEFLNLSSQADKTVKARLLDLVWDRFVKNEALSKPLLNLLSVELNQARRFTFCFGLCEPRFNDSNANNSADNHSPETPLQRFAGNALFDSNVVGIITSYVDGIPPKRNATP